MKWHGEHVVPFCFEIYGLCQAEISSIRFCNTSGGKPVVIMS